MLDIDYSIMFDLRWSYKLIVCLTIYRYAANKASMRECSVLFNMAESTQLVVINRVMDFMCQIAPNVIHFSSDKQAVAKDFLNVSV